MILFVNGDIFGSKARTLVNPVNCRGVMGKGLALEFKRRWPDMHREYAKRCALGAFRPGRPVLFPGDAERQILCFPTKDDWREPSSYGIVEAGLIGLRGGFRHSDFVSMAFPALGCGLGGLEWAEVKPLFAKHLYDWPIEIEVYGPQGAA